MFRPAIRSKTRFDPFNVLFGWSFAVFAIAMLPAAHADIFKCTDEYGNAAYLQTPCPVEKVKEVAATEEPEPRTDEVAQVEEVPESPPEPQSAEAPTASSGLTGDQLYVCKKRYRDLIDEIDAEMRVSFTPAQGDEYKGRLKVLTRQLRACG